MGFEPSQNSDWDLNPWAGTWTYCLLRSHTWFQDLTKLRFFMSQRRRNSGRGKVIGKKCIYLERYTFHRQNAVCLKRQEQLQNMEWLVFMGWLCNFIGQQVGGLFQLFWRRGGEFQDLGHLPLIGLLWLTSELFWLLWVCHLAYANDYNECIMRVRVYWKSNLLPSWD